MIKWKKQRYLWLLGQKKREGKEDTQVDFGNCKCLKQAGAAAEDLEKLKVLYFSNSTENT